MSSVSLNKIYDELKSTLIERVGYISQAVFFQGVFSRHLNDSQPGWQQGQVSIWKSLFNIPLFLCCKTQKVDLYAGHRESGRRKHSKEPAFKRMKELGSLFIDGHGGGKWVGFSLALVAVKCWCSPVASAHMQASGGMVSDPPWGPALLECVCLH